LVVSISRLFLQLEYLLKNVLRHRLAILCKMDLNYLSLAQEEKLDGNCLVIWAYKNCYSIYTYKLIGFRCIKKILWLGFEYLLENIFLWYNCTLWLSGLLCKLNKFVYLLNIDWSFTLKVEYFSTAANPILGEISWHIVF
jgi:hypothetical protein